jgi:hypothetical protein
MIIARYLVEYTDHRVITILQGLRPLRVRSPPRSPGHGVVGAINKDRASSISVVAISRSSTYGGLISVDVLLYFWAVRNACCQKEASGSYSSIRLWIVGWRHPLDNTRCHKVGLVRSQPAMSIRPIDREEWALTTPGCDGYLEPELLLGVDGYCP